MTMSILVTVDDELGEVLNGAVGDGNRSSVVAEAVREYLDRRAIAAASASTFNSSSGSRARRGRTGRAAGPHQRSAIVATGVSGG
jgi:hypothetical protein